MKTRIAQKIALAVAVLAVVLLVSNTAMAGGWHRFNRCETVFVPAPVYVAPAYAPTYYYPAPGYAAPQYVVVPAPVYRTPVYVTRPFYHHRGFAVFIR
jgi:hypothetical protein